jgi:ribosomal subunit interface protein
LQIEVTVRHTSVAPEMKAYARKKAERLLKYYNRIQAIRVLLDHSGGGFSCEMIADVEHASDLVGHTTGPDLRAAVDQTVDRVERQLIELKDRTRHRKGRGPNPHQPTRT